MVLINKEKIIYFIIFLLPLFNIHFVSAHQPFEIIPNQINETSIDLSDGTVSHAFYGEFSSKNQEVIFNLDNLHGNPLDISILIPDKNPENLSSEDLFPAIHLITGSTQQSFLPDIRSDFYEPFSRMNLIRIFEYKEDKFVNNNAVVKIVSKSPMRYVFSVGYKEIFSKRYAYGDTNPFAQNSQQIWYKKGDLFSDESNITQQNQSGKEIFYVIIFLFILVIFYGIFLFRNQIFYKIKR